MRPCVRGSRHVGNRAIVEVGQQAIAGEGQVAPAFVVLAQRVEVTVFEEHAAQTCAALGVGGAHQLAYRAGRNVGRKVDPRSNVGGGHLETGGTGNGDDPVGGRGGGRQARTAGQGGEVHDVTDGEPVGAGGFDGGARSLDIIGDIGEGECDQRSEVEVIDTIQDTGREVGGGGLRLVDVDREAAATLALQLVAEPAVGGVGQASNALPTHRVVGGVGIPNDVCKDATHDQSTPGAFRITCHSVTRCGTLSTGRARST